MSIFLIEKHPTISDLQRALARARSSRKAAESLLEQKSRELYDRNEELLESRSQLKDANDALQDLNASLLAEVAERTEEALEAKRIAEEANEAKTRFLAMMSHEMRTPLGAIMGFADLLGTPDASERSLYIRRLQLNADVLLHMIEDILDFSTLEAGAIKLNQVAFEPRALFEAVGEMIATRVHAKGLTFSIDIGSDVPQWVLGDEVRINQLLLNLIGNAIKYTNEGYILLRLQCLGQIADVEEGACSGGISLRYDVIDSGPGIPKNARDTIFERFTRLKQRGADAPGAGLGLSICKSLVQLMGGQIGVMCNSKASSGSCFYVQLEHQVPKQVEITSKTSFNRCEAVEHAVFDSGDRTEILKRPNLGTEDNDQYRILVVDDDYDHRTLITAMLAGAGYHIVVVDNGLQAIEQLHATSFDLVLTDLQMPVMDGFEIAGRIRSSDDDATMSTVPIIALSAHALPQYQQACMDAKMNDFLTKPLSKERLVKKVKHWIKANSDTPTRDEIMRERRVTTLYGDQRVSEKNDAAAYRSAKDTHIVNISPDVIDLVPRYLKNRADDIVAMRGLLNSPQEKSSLVEIAAIAHKMKGSGAGYGFGHISDIGGRLERAAIDGDENRVKDLVNELDEYLKNVSYVSQQE